MRENGWEKTGALLFQQAGPRVNSLFILEQPTEMDLLHTNACFPHGRYASFK
jgi:hypothetical protein